MNNDFSDISTRFLRMWGTFNPYDAFSTGMREYAGFVNVETPEFIASYKNFLNTFQKRLSKISYNELSEKDKVEFLLLDNKIQMELFNIIDKDTYHSDPIHYVGIAFIFDFLIKKYAPLDQRIKELSLHFNHFPTYFGQAVKNLVVDNLSHEYVEQAGSMVSGMISFLTNLEEELHDIVSENDPISENTMQMVLKSNKLAITSLDEYLNFLNTSLPKTHASFRLGKNKYLEMLKTNERVENITIESLLEYCEKNLQSNLQEFEAAAKKIDPSKSAVEIMEGIRRNHPTKESLLTDAKNILSLTKEFCRNMVDVPSEIMPNVVYTPKPFREWAFAMMNSPGPMETVATDSFYYITPPDESWPEDQQEDWLGTFNFKGLIDVTVHECFPGHYLHDLHNNRSPYLFSKLFGAYHFWEGYALHVEEEMWQIGFQAGDYEYRMAQLAETLLRNVRMIVSIKLHTTTAFTVEDGIQLFMKYAFMGRKPAESEAKRGTYDPGYLNYCLGKLMIEKLKEDFKQEKGSNFNNKEFYNTLLSYGAPPIPIVRKFMLTNKEIHDQIL